MRIPDEIKAELADLHFAMAGPQQRFRVNRVARGWIIEDRASSAMVSFHLREVDAVRALIQTRRLARDGWMPRDVPVERLVRLRNYFEERVRLLERDLTVNGPASRRYAKVTGNALAASSAILERLRKAIVDATRTAA